MGSALSRKAGCRSGRLASGRPKKQDCSGNFSDCRAEHSVTIPSGEVAIRGCTRGHRSGRVPLAPKGKRSRHGVPREPKRSPECRLTLELPSSHLCDSEYSSKRTSAIGPFADGRDSTSSVLAGEAYFTTIRLRPPPSALW